jgi:tRNA(Arg) A34 adenosine deaminase TadA
MATVNSPETFEAGFERVTGAPAPPIDNPQLQHYWNLPVSDLCTVAVPPADQSGAWPMWQERHRLYMYLLMGIGWFYWCGNKDGRFGTYPYNDPATPQDPPWLSGDYRGHNILAVAVDGRGQVVDFDFNHNNLFSSSAEHAEARLVRRLYALANVGGAWAPTDPDSSDGTSLQGFTVYTSLESCSQCSGIMALAGVENVVFMQQDPGEYLIGRILHNLTPPSFQAPLPISGHDILLEEFDELGNAYADYLSEIATGKPFFTPSDGSSPDPGKSITSFLCTGAARGIYAGGRAKMNGTLLYPTFTPSIPGESDVCSNQQVQEACLTFLNYAVKLPNRGTPHRD